VDNSGPISAAFANYFLLFFAMECKNNSVTPHAKINSVAIVAN
jgi:hypothetical protein